MLGLIAIQSYWIINSYNIKETHFNFEVNKALSETIKQLETEETIFEISNEVFQMAENKDSVIEKSVENYQKSFDKHKDEYSTIANRSTITVNGEHIEKADTSFQFSSSTSSNKLSQNNTVLKISSGDVRNIIQNKVNNKTLFVEKIVNQILNYNEDIIKRIQDVDLKQMIENKLNEHDIDIQFEYAIKSEGKRVFSTSTFKEHSSKLYSKRLFPNNLFHDNDFLELYIPNRTSFIVMTMIPVILITVVLTFLIIGVVIFTFIIVVRQKQLGDIKNDFVNNLTHELKTPIATISLAGQMLCDKDIQTTQSSIERYAQIINQESARLTTQVEKVLQIALIDKGELKLKDKKIDVNKLVERLVKPFGLKVDNYKGQLIVNLPENPVWIYADELHFSNVINNLLDNALKYKYKEPIIEVTIEEDNHNIFISVKDNGIGISKVDQMRIFEKFYRVESGNVHNIKGFGLGLSYVKKIIDIYKGQIEVKSKLKHGSTFTLKMPKPEFSKQNN